MSYAQQSGESTEQYVDRIRSEAASGSISSGPGGSLLQSAIDQARGYGPGSGGQPSNRSQSVSDSFFNTASGQGAYAAGSANKPVYGSVSGGLSTTAPNFYNANMPGTNPIPSSNPTMFTPGINPDVYEQGRRDVLYNLQNPEFALQNALRAKGVNLYNPIIRRSILPAAQGLGTAYTIQGAMGQNGPMTDVSGGFSSFLQNALSGAAGGIRGATGSAMSNLGGLGEILQNAANQQNAQQGSTNPFIGALLSSLYDPTALTGMQTALAMPWLGPGLTSGLQELLGLKSANAWNQIGQGENFYKYLAP